MFLNLPILATQPTNVRTIDTPVETVLRLDESGLTKGAEQGIIQKVLRGVIDPKIESELAELVTAKPKDFEAVLKDQRLLEQTPNPEIPVTEAPIFKQQDPALSDAETVDADQPNHKPVPSVPREGKIDLTEAKANPVMGERDMPKSDPRLVLVAERPLTVSNTPATYADSNAVNVDQRRPVAGFHIREASPSQQSIQSQLTMSKAEVVTDTKPAPYVPVTTNLATSKPEVAGHDAPKVDAPIRSNYAAITPDPAKPNMPQAPSTIGAETSRTPIASLPPAPLPNQDSSRFEPIRPATLPVPERINTSPLPPQPTPAATTIREGMTLISNPPATASPGIQLSRSDAPVLPSRLPMAPDNVSILTKSVPPSGMSTVVPKSEPRDVVMQSSRHFTLPEQPVKVASASPPPTPPKLDNSVQSIPIPALAASPLTTAALRSDSLKDSAPLLVDDLAGVTSQTSATTSASTPTPMAPRNYGPHVAAQIANAIVQSAGGTTEIALNPEELGRVRISLTSSENGMVVSILADRPETADLMRRNIDSLAREFLDLGHENLSFSFGDDAPQDNSSNEAVPTTAASTRDDHDPIDAVQNMKTALRGGLDLKL